ncbi:hypothetical protein WICMUC_002864 [Wickerhamomyces mucosus]|uniref:Hpc2-related domain-containing protein n=1 Tax=Wickerhamomyces mucosus TaxID=1378264 RepID=A0A9P8PMX6_9ASCO|nr:hypothetical protein WICMUC_002864 [Wickerhamomyces mucosus]
MTENQSISISSLLSGSGKEEKQSPQNIAPAQNNPPNRKDQSQTPQSEQPRYNNETIVIISDTEDDLPISQPIQTQAAKPVPIEPQNETIQIDDDDTSLTEEKEVTIKRNVAEQSSKNPKKSEAVKPKRIYKPRTQEKKDDDGASTDQPKPKRKYKPRTPKDPKINEEDKLKTQESKTQETDSKDERNERTPSKTLNINDILNGNDDRATKESTPQNSLPPIAKSLPISNNEVIQGASQASSKADSNDNNEKKTKKEIKPKSKAAPKTKKVESKDGKATNEKTKPVSRSKKKDDIAPTASKSSKSSTSAASTKKPSIPSNTSKKGDKKEAKGSEPNVPLTYEQQQNQNLKQTIPNVSLPPPRLIEIELEEEAAEPIIALHVPLSTKEIEPGSTQVVFNVMKMAEDTYGWNKVHPNSSKFQNLLNDDADDMDIDDDDEEDDEEEPQEPEPKVDGRKSQKGKPKIGQYDYEDPFIDDTEMLWEEQRASTKDGFFVFYGPLVEEGKSAKIEKIDGKVKRTRKRVANTTLNSASNKKKSKTSGNSTNANTSNQSTPNPSTHDQLKTLAPIAPLPKE